MMRLLTFAALLPLMACTTTLKPEDASGPLDCGETRVADLLGKPWTEAMRAPTLKRTGARTIRVIAPGDAVTMDYRTDRLNIETDAAGRVTKVRCG
ncbi:I78 family peptidase inhibitor [Sphingomonas sp.]|uniref:I78 family peptidase inhibitor n=1 Tax=Sphingomonas sp. TaxID=28214 RepID=UPI0028A291F3|nr:I78 family peptidase inhibitor [Sphingomonas sp.]